MAEFVEVCKQWKRICIAQRNEEQECAHCPVNDYRMCGFEVSDITEDEFKKTEDAIVQWAAEHPEPEPIVWQDFLLDYYCEYIKKQGNETKTVDEWIARDPIPEDIVQKLGIKKETWNTNV